MNFEFVVKQKYIKEVRNNKLIHTNKTFLCTKDKTTGILYPHPISNFIKGEFDRKQLAPTTLKRYAEIIKMFLNFILENIEDEDETFINLEEEGLSGLGLKHGSDYITFLTRKNKLGQLEADTVLTAERIIIGFYRWLSEQGIIKEKITYKEQVRNYKGEKRTILISPFDNSELGTEYPNRHYKKKKITRLHDFGAGRLDLVNLFIRIAELEASDIALGIALQCYGGLRKGEIVNLKRSSVNRSKHSGSGEYIVDITDNWETLFPDKELTVSEQVKKPRIQAIFKVPIVMELSDKQDKFLETMDRKGKTKNKEAFFISKHTGKPITGMGYYERFTKVRKKFLEILLENGYTDEYRNLTSNPWSTHIGRGIFTNLLYFRLGWSPAEIAIARGDSSIQSSKDYVELQNVKKKTEKAIEVLAMKTLDEEEVSKIEDLWRGSK